MSARIRLCSASVQAAARPRDPRTTESHAREILLDVLARRGSEEVPRDDKAERDEVLAELRRKGLSIRQIERLTGIGKNIIARAK